MITRITEKNGQYHIPATQMRSCGFKRGAELLCCPGDDVCVILRDRMTAKELIAAAYRLRDVTRSLMDLLAEGCGPCRECGPVCRPLSTIGKPVEATEDTLFGAGIPAGAKLTASVDGDAHRIIVTEADYAYDLRDLPPDFVDLLDGADGPSICFASLDRHLIRNDVICEAALPGLGGE